MAGISREQESWVSSRNLIQPQLEAETETQTDLEDDVSYQETEEIWPKMSQNNTTTSSNITTTAAIKNSNNHKGLLKKKKCQVLLEGYVEGTDDNEDDLKRTKSLTGEDLDELKGCLDLGFGFSYDEIPELCNTLPALELCYSMSQKFLDEHHKSPERSSPAAAEAASSPVANWKISSPGDHPEDVKARLKFWAQAVACTVKLCR